MATNYNASTNHIQRPGLRNVGSYQVSGWPYTTGSAVADTARYKVSFPYVTKSITV